MAKSIFVLALAIVTCGPALSAELGLEGPHTVQTTRHRLPPERHVIEVVRPPYSGAYIINGTPFTAASAACADWNAGERITLLAGDWHGRCVGAVFYNVARHRSCQMWCG
jgi:hypothetical protein